MKTGIELLQSTELLLVEHCECGRERCSSCVLRGEIGTYLDAALHRDDPPAAANDGRAAVDRYRRALTWGPR